jgi:hypothetical protein
MRRLPLVLLTAVLVFASAAYGAPSKLKNDLQVTGNLTVGGTTTQTGNVALTGNLSVTGTTTHTGAVTNSSTLTQTGVATFTAAPVLSTGTVTANGGDTYTVPDVGNASFVMTAGAQTVAGVKTFSSAPVVPDSSFTAAKIATGSAKRQTMVWHVNGGGTLSDSATYTAMLPYGRAATVTRVSCVCGTAPIGGGTVKVLKGSSSGNTQLDAATFDATGLVANTISNLTLTATGADLALAATEPTYLEWATGTQDTDGANCAISVEYEPDNF